MRKRIHVGPAGWSYKDWEGVVYPAKSGSKFDPLAYLAQFFDTIEINSSFYRPPSASTSKSWAKRVAQNPHFLFTAKLHQVFTHERGKATREDETMFREGMDPLAEAGKLGAVLLQFPWSFKNTRRSLLLEKLSSASKISLGLKCATLRGTHRRSTKHENTGSESAMSTSRIHEVNPTGHFDDPRRLVMSDCPEELSRLVPRRCSRTTVTIIFTRWRIGTVDCENKRGCGAN